MGQYGIINMKTLIGFIFESVSKIEGIDKNGDGKAKPKEVLGALFPVLWDIAGVYKSVPAFAQEFKDLSEAEKTELMLELREKFDIKNDKIEVLIEDLIDYILTGYMLVIKHVESFASPKPTTEQIAQQIRNAQKFIK